MKILCCGDREWDSLVTILHRLELLKGEVEVIHGDCRGADKKAAMVAKDLSFKVKAFPADWDKHGKKAGPMRNLQMLDEKPDLVIAFHNNLHESKGTAHTVGEAHRRGIPVEIISSKWWPVFVTLPAGGS